MGATPAFGIGPATWTGEYSSQMRLRYNWDPQVPYYEVATFNGNGNNSPLSNQEGGITFSEMQFTASTEVSVISGIQIDDIAGVTVNPGITATFDIYEHQPLIFGPASVRINTGSTGGGGGTVLYNLESYGQLYAYSGSTDGTVINITMTGGNNYFEIDGPGTNIFDNVSSDTDSDDIYVVTDSNLTIRGLNTNIINGAIAGDGSLTKTGSSTLVLNNDNTYTGGTLISEGVLELNGSISGDLTVNANAILKGTGSVNGTALIEGQISPGNSIGTLTVGNYVSTSSSVFSCEINSLGSSDQIIATGSMILDGTLDIIPLDLSFTSSQTYTILQSETGISGAFSDIQTTIPALTSLSYTTNGVSLTYLPLSSIVLNGNAAEVATCFFSLSGSDVNAVKTELLSLSISDIEETFNHMQPSQFSAQTWTQLANALLVRSSYSKHLREFSLHKRCSDEFQSDVWVDTMGQWEQQHAKNNQFGYNDWTAGASIGTDASYKKFRFGVAASYTYSKVNWNQSAGHGQINSYYGGAYGGWSNDNGYVILSSLGAYNHYNNSRYLSIGNMNRHTSGSHNGWEVLTGLEGGGYFKTNHLKVGPFARVDYIYLWQDGYRESGADSLNLHIHSRQDQLIQSQGGIAFTSNYECNPTRKYGTLIPRLEISYINQSPLGKTNYLASFKDSDCEFSVSGWSFKRNLGAVGVSITYLTPSERFGISLQYDGQFGYLYSNQSGDLTFNINY